MKKVGRPVAVLIAVLSIAIFVISMFGISTQYGDVVTKTVLSAKDVSRGLGFSLDAVSVIKTEENLDQKTLEKSLDNMEARLAKLSIPDYTLSADLGSKTITLRTSYDETSSYSPAQTANFIAQKGEFTVRIGAERDENGKMTGETAEDDSILLTNADIKNVYTTYNVQNNSNYYFITVELTSSAATRYANAVKGLIDSGNYSELSWWIDDSTMIYKENLDSVTNSSAITVYSEDWTSASATIYALYMQSEPLPVAFVYGGNTVAQEPGFGSGTLKALLIASVISTAAVMAFLIIKYKLIGLSASVCLIGSLGAEMAVCSGLVANTKSSMYLTVFSFAVFAATVLLTAERTIRCGEEVKDSLADGCSVNKAVGDAFVGRFWDKVQILVPILLGGIVLHFCFFKKTNFIGRIASAISGGAAIPAASGFGFAAAVAALCAFLFGYVLMGLMVKSLASYKSLDSNKLFGGNEE